MVALHRKHRTLFVLSLWGQCVAMQCADDSISNCSKMGSTSLISSLVPVGLCIHMWASLWVHSCSIHSPGLDPKEGHLKLLVCRLPSGRPNGCDIDHRPSVSNITWQSFGVFSKGRKVTVNWSHHAADWLLEQLDFQSSHRGWIATTTQMTTAAFTFTKPSFNQAQTFRRISVTQGPHGANDFGFKNGVTYKASPKMKLPLFLSIFRTSAQHKLMLFQVGCALECRISTSRWGLYRSLPLLALESHSTHP